MNIAKSISKGMALKGYSSQYQVAESADLSQGIVSQLATGKILKPRHETLSKLAYAFDVRISEFIKWGEE